MQPISKGQWFCSVCLEDQEGDCMEYRDKDGRAVCPTCQSVGRKTWEDAR